MEIKTGNPQVIIADTSREFLQTCGENLRLLGIDAISQVTDAVEAFEQIARLKPKVVISDAYLEKNDILWLMREVNMRMGNAAPWFIVLSSFNNHGFFEECCAAGASYCMQKPFDYSFLAERIFRLSARDRRQNGLLSLALTDSELEEQVTKIIQQIGIPAHIKGYQYLRTSLIMVIKNGDLMDSVTKTLYPAVAKIYSTTPTRVERAIRHAIEVAWDRGNAEVLKRFFCRYNGSMSYKPTNSEFIAQIADDIRLKNKLLARAY